MLEATPSTRLFPNFAGDALKTWVFHNRVTLVGDAAHTHGGAFAAGGSLAIDDAYALSLALNHVWPAWKAQDGKPSSQDLATILSIYEKTRQPHINRVLSVVKQQVVGRRGAEEETDAELVARIVNRMDPSWISEHDVEGSFVAALTEREEEVALTNAKVVERKIKQMPQANL